MTVILKDDAELLDEVVVVGYGTMKKRDLSGAVSQIKSDDLMKGNPTDLSKGLAGKIAGVQVNQSDGAPGRRHQYSDSRYELFLYQLTTSLYCRRRTV